MQILNISNFELQNQHVRDSQMKSARPQANIIVHGRQHVPFTPLTLGSVHTASSMDAGESTPESRVSTGVVSVANKLLLKAFSESKKASKTFALRNLTLTMISSVEKLKEEIKSQLCDDMVQDFDLGFLEGFTQLSIPTSNDITEMWSDFSQGKKVILWCDGLK